MSSSAVAARAPAYTYREARPRPSIVRRVFGLLPLPYTACLVLYLAASRLIAPEVPPGVPDRVWWWLYSLVSLMNEFTPFYFLPLPLCLLTLLIARTPGAVIATGIPCLLFVLLYGPLFLPRPPEQRAPASAAGAAPSAGVDVRVMTFNLLATARTMDERAAAIHQAAPDVVLVQELTQSQGRALDAALLPQYPYGRVRTDRPGWEGAGIWSRFPLEFEELWDGSRRGARWQHAVLSVEGQPVHVVNLHLMTPVLRWRRLPDVPLPIATGEITQGRSLEVSWLVPRLQSLIAGGDPVIVAGDLNMTDQTPEYRRLLSAGLVDAHRQAGWGFGHSYPAHPTLRIAGRRLPVPVPLVRIDYVLLSPHVQAVHVETWPDSGGSDHLPVVADLTLVHGS